MFLNRLFYSTNISFLIIFQEFTVIDDYITGLKANLYLKTLEHCKDWDNQSPIIQPHQKGKPLPDLGVTLPNFGKFKKAKQELVAKKKVSRPVNNIMLLYTI